MNYKSIGKLLSTAKRVEFWLDEGTPPIMLLVFDSTEAANDPALAYNKLYDIVSSKSTYLKIEKGNKLTLNIVDAVGDFHIPIKDLHYYHSQYEAFMESPNHTFGFCLGLRANHSERPMILPTKEPFEIITLAGRIN